MRSNTSTGGQISDQQAEQHSNIQCEHFLYTDGTPCQPYLFTEQGSITCWHQNKVLDLMLHFGRQALEAKRCLLESLQKRCTAAQAKLDGEYSHLGSLEAKTQELESLRKVCLPACQLCSPGGSENLISSLCQLCLLLCHFCWIHAVPLLMAALYARHAVPFLLTLVSHVLLPL